MPSSDSEDFESADEGHSNLHKRERKHRHSSSNYSDNALEADGDSKASITAMSKEKPKTTVEQSDGWDDFDVDVSEPVTLQAKQEHTMTKTTSKQNENIKLPEKSQDTGWDDFDDWGDQNAAEVVESQPQKASATQDCISEVTDRLANSSASNAGSGGWGWGWGVDSLLSSASAGITTLTSQVSQGITTVLETGIGAPDPEELARKTRESETSAKTPDQPSVSEERSVGDAFAFGNLLKFVGDTGSKVITGGLDTLETIGRKTMEVLQDGDPGLAKKRALLSLGQERLVLSQVLREAKDKAEEEDKLREEKREAKEVHYERLFDDFEGLVHLEALEMLSKQVSMRIEEQMKAASADRRQDMKETLQQVAELCEMPEEDETESLSEGEGDGATGAAPSASETLRRRLQAATRDLGAKLHFQPLIKQYEDTITWLNSPESSSVKVVNKLAISSLAQATALSVELYHKAGEMLLVKARRSTADEADAMMQMTVVLTKHTSELANLFTEKLHTISTEDPALCNTYITNIFLEAGNSATYIQNAFLLIQPIIQIGAI